MSTRVSPKMMAGTSDSCQFMLVPKLSTSPKLLLGNSHPFWVGGHTTQQRMEGKAMGSLCLPWSNVGLQHSPCLSTISQADPWLNVAPNFKTRSPFVSVGTRVLVRTPGSLQSGSSGKQMVEWVGVEGTMVLVGSTPPPPCFLFSSPRGQAGEEGRKCCETGERSWG